MIVKNEIITLKNSVIALGFFDGVHAGHLKIINRLVECARKYNIPSAIITFKQSPAEFFLQNVSYITDNNQKEQIISKLGVDYMFELNFDKNLKDMTHHEYLKILCNNLNPKAIITGFNHTFGEKKLGTPEYLKQNESTYGYEYIEVPAVKMSEEIVSSTLIKHYLSIGDIKTATSMLCREFAISGSVIEGNKIGRTIGFPTANIKYPDKIIQIPYGVYQCDVEVNKKYYKGILNYGKKPTIKETKKTPVAEVHIIGFNSNIYGEQITVNIKNKIRDERKFESLEELKKQISEDLKQC